MGRGKRPRPLVPVVRNPQLDRRRLFRYDRAERTPVCLTPSVAGAISQTCYAETLKSTAVRYACQTLELTAWNRHRRSDKRNDYYTDGRGDDGCGGGGRDDDVRTECHDALEREHHGHSKIQENGFLRKERERT